MYHDETINYTNYLKDKPQEKDPEKIDAMERQTAEALAARGIFYGLTFRCYADGCVKVCVNGEYYGVFNTSTGKFFNGYVGG